MSILQKLNTAFRGGVREAAEAVIDANSLRILGQEIHECEQDISSSKQKLALIIAEKMQVEREIKQLSTSNKIHEETITLLLEEENESQAEVIAQIIAEQEPKIKQKQQHFDQLKAHEESLQSSLKKMIFSLNSFKSEYQMAKATANMQQAQSALASSSMTSSSRFVAMQESLDKIQEKQQSTADKMAAMEKVNAALSINPIDQNHKQEASASDILQRIKDKERT